MHTHPALLTYASSAGVFKVSSEDELFLLMRDDRAARVLPSLQAALQVHQTRASECGKTFEHMVLLQAAVQGWHVSGLLLAIPSPGTDQTHLYIRQEGIPSLHLNFRAQYPGAMAMLDFGFAEGSNKQGYLR